ncbi:MAG: short-chain dehydrogenase [Proteobacteria bacterium SG_bin6]|nr:MAG: short-chain dehydrogenase [Proteobacteria bacterium SG_bin6]
MIAGGRIIVTGGASGLGAEIARVLAEAGGKVMIADLQAEAAEAVAAEIGGEAFTLDLTDAAACQVLIDRVASDGGIDVLVNNAGTDKTESIEELDQADFDRVIDVNLRAPFALAKAAFPHLKAKGRGAIINIVSTAAKRAWANATAYHASKWGLLGLSHAMHVEGRPLGIKVTALLAGGMRTPFILDRFPDTPLENLQDPRAVAETVRFLIEQPADTVIPELLVVPMRETSWP